MYKNTTLRITDISLLRYSVNNRPSKHIDAHTTITENSAVATCHIPNNHYAFPPVYKHYRLLIKQNEVSAKKKLI